MSHVKDYNIIIKKSKKVIKCKKEWRGKVPSYKYKAKDLNGKYHKGTISLDNPQALYSYLKEQQLFCISYREEQQKKKKEKRLKTKTLVILSRQIATMLNSGISIIKCIDILHEQAEDIRLKAILSNLYMEIQKGNLLSSTLREQGQVFPDLFVAMIEAGEKSGSLDEAFERLAIHYEKEKELEEKIKNAMIYPIILGVVSIGVLLILLLYVVPNFFTLFTEMIDTLPWSTKFLLNLSSFLMNNWMALITVLGIMILSMFAFAGQPWLKRYKEQLYFALPVVGKLNRIIISARFAETLCTLYASGLSLIECVDMTQKVINHAQLDKRLDKVKEEIAVGTPLSLALKHTNIFPAMLIHMIQIGEESGQLEEILEKTSKFYAQEADTAIKKLIALLEPTMIVVLGIVVGFIVAAIVPSMYNVYQHIQ